MGVRQSLSVLHMFSNAADLPISLLHPLLTEPALKAPFLSAFETGSRSDHCGLLASAKAGE
jgi:hypothetical protein